MAFNNSIPDFDSIEYKYETLLSRGTLFNPISTEGEENKYSSGHVRIHINVNKTWMDLPFR